MNVVYSHILNSMYQINHVFTCVYRIEQKKIQIIFVYIILFM